MASETIRIEELHLRVPGLSREEARRLAEDVARLVADALPASGRSEHLGALDIRTSIPNGTPRDRLASLIAGSILEKLR